MKFFTIKALCVGVVAFGFTVASGSAALAADNASAQADSQNQQSQNQQNQNQQNQATDGAQNNRPANNQSANTTPDKQAPDVNTQNKNTRDSNGQAPASTTTNTNEAQPVVPDNSAAPSDDSAAPAAATIPAGTSIFIRTVETLDSGQTQLNTVFHGTTTSDIYVGNQVVIPSGTNVEGKVTRVRDAAHFAGKSLLALQLTKMVLGGKSYDILTDEWSRYGRDRSRDSANKISGGVFIGTVIGAATGGGKGAVIGASIGATTGAAIQGATRGQQVHLDPERVISFKLQNPLSLGAPPQNGNTNQQQPDNDDPYDQ